MLRILSVLGLLCGTPVVAAHMRGGPGGNGLSSGNSTLNTHHDLVGHRQLALSTSATCCSALQWNMNPADATPGNVCNMGCNSVNGWISSIDQASYGDPTFTGNGCTSISPGTCDYPNILTVSALTGMIGGMSTSMAVSDASFPNPTCGTFPRTFVLRATCSFCPWPSSTASYAIDTVTQQKTSTTYKCNAGYYGASTTITCDTTTGYLTGSTPTCNQCTPGSYCSMAGMTNPITCTGGYYCPAGTINPIPCSPGYRCPSGVSAPTPCATGTFSNTSQLSGACTSCSPGKYCNATAAIAVSGICAPGYYCIGGATTPTPPTGPTGGPCGAGYYCAAGVSSQNTCPAGNYCPALSSAPTPCAVGTVNAATLRSTPCANCTAGYYCATSGLFTPSGSCAAGYLCFGGATTAAPTDGITGRLCNAGFYCPNATTETPCPAGAYCTAGQSSPAACLLGQFNNMTQRSSCFPCTPGYGCLSTGLQAPTGPCNAGFYCISGATSLQPTDGTLGNMCPPGAYCPVGSSAPTPCAIGTYSGISGRGIPCANCAPGMYCNTTGLTAPVGNCSAGFFCQAGSNSSMPADSRCPPGKYCPAGSAVPITCPTGAICPYAQMGAPQLCPPGTFMASTGSSAANCTACPAGAYCQSSGLATFTALCSAGYICLNGSSVPTPVDGIVGYRCPAGFYCPGGALAPTPCSPGTYYPSQGATANTSCFTCSAGYVCRNSNTTVPSPCPPGFYCPAGSSLPVTCTAGGYCAGYSSIPFPCPAKSYCPAGSISGQTCPGGVWSVPSGTPSYTNATCAGPCTAGYYCPQGSTNSTAFQCGGPAWYCPVGVDAPLPVPANAYSTPTTDATLYTRTDYAVGPTRRFCSGGILYPAVELSGFCGSDGTASYVLPELPSGVFLGSSFIATNPGDTVNNCAWSIVTPNQGSYSTGILPLDPVGNCTSALLQSLGTSVSIIGAGSVASLFVASPGIPYRQCGQTNMLAIVRARRVTDLSLYADCNVTLSVTRVNAAPVFTQTSYASSLDEGTLPGTSIVDTIPTATDANPTDTVTYRLVSITPSAYAGMFAIDAVSGIVRYVGSQPLTYVEPSIAGLAYALPQTVTVDIQAIDDSDPALFGASPVVPFYVTITRIAPRLPLERVIDNATFTMDVLAALESVQSGSGAMVPMGNITAWSPYNFTALHEQAVADGIAPSNGTVPGVVLSFQWMLLYRIDVSPWAAGGVFAMSGARSLQAANATGANTTANPLAALPHAINITYFADFDPQALVDLGIGVGLGNGLPIDPLGLPGGGPDTLLPSAGNFAVPEPAAVPSMPSGTPGARRLVDAMSIMPSEGTGSQTGLPQIRGARRLTYSAPSPGSELSTSRRLQNVVGSNAPPFTLPANWTVAPVPLLQPPVLIDQATGLFYWNPAAAQVLLRYYAYYRDASVVVSAADTFHGTSTTSSYRLSLRHANRPPTFRLPATIGPNCVLRRNATSGGTSAANASMIQCLITAASASDAVVPPLLPYVYDPDLYLTGLGENITFSITRLMRPQNLHTNITSTAGLFDVDAATGRVFVSAPGSDPRLYDPGGPGTLRPSFLFVVIAYDAGIDASTDPARAEVGVAVNVTLVPNNNPPVCSDYEWSIDAEGPVDELIGTMQPFDPDVSAGLQAFSFTIINVTAASDPLGTSATPLIDVAQGGQVRTAAPIDYFYTGGAVNATINVSDGAGGECLSRVGIIIREVNDRPTINETTLFVPAFAPNATIVGVVVGEDRNTNGSPWSTLRYALLPPPFPTASSASTVSGAGLLRGNYSCLDAFTIDAVTGTVSVARRPVTGTPMSVVLLPNDVYTCTVLVTDGGGLNATATLHIGITQTIQGCTFSSFPALFTDPSTNGYFCSRASWSQVYSMPEPQRTYASWYPYGTAIGDICARICSVNSWIPFGPKRFICGGDNTWLALQDTYTTWVNASTQAPPTSFMSLALMDGATTVIPLRIALFLSRTRWAVASDAAGVAGVPPNYTTLWRTLHGQITALAPHNVTKSLQCVNPFPTPPAISNVTRCKTGTAATLAPAPVPPVLNAFMTPARMALGAWSQWPEAMDQWHRLVSAYTVPSPTYLVWAVVLAPYALASPSQCTGVPNAIMRNYATIANLTMRCVYSTSIVDMVQVTTFNTTSAPTSPFSIELPLDAPLSTLLTRTGQPAAGSGEFVALIVQSVTASGLSNKASAPLPLSLTGDFLASPQLAMAAYSCKAIATFIGDPWQDVSSVDARTLPASALWQAGGTMVASTPTKRLIVSDSLPPTPLAIGLPFTPAASEEVTITCTADLSGLVVRPPGVSLRRDATSGALSVTLPAGSGSAAVTSGAADLFRVIGAPVDAGDDGTSSGADGAFTLWFTVQAAYGFGIDPTANTSLPHALPFTVTCNVLSAPASGAAADTSGGVTRIFADSTHLAFEGVAIRTAWPRWADAIVHLAADTVRSGWASTVTRVPPITIPVSTDDAVGISAQAGAAKDQQITAVASAVAASAGTRRPRFSLTVSGAVNMTLVSANFNATAAPIAPGAVQIQLPTFTPLTRIFVGSVECPVLWISADGNMATFRTPRYDDLCAAVANDTDCGWQPLTVVNQGVTLSHVLLAQQVSTPLPSIASGATSAALFTSIATAAASGNASMTAHGSLLSGTSVAMLTSQALLGALLDASLTMPLQARNLQALGALLGTQLDGSAVASGNAVPPSTASVLGAALSCPPFCGGADPSVPLSSATATANASQVLNALTLGGSGTLSGSDSVVASADAFVPAMAAPLRETWVGAPQYAIQQWAAGARLSNAPAGALYYTLKCTGLWPDPLTGVCDDPSSPTSKQCAYGTGDRCRLCPDGALCVGGWLLNSRPGYWLPLETASDSQLVSCPAPSTRCAGWDSASRTSICAPGYRQSSPACGACDTGYYSSLDGTCRQCPVSATIADVLVPFIVFAAVLLGVALVTMTAVVIVTRVVKGKSMPVKDAARKTFGFVVSAASALQFLIQVMRASEPGLPPRLLAIYRYASLLQFHNTLMPAECIGKDAPLVSDMIVMCIALALMLASGALQLCGACARGSGGGGCCARRRGALKKYAFTLLNLMMAVVSNSAFGLLSCQQSTVLRSVQLEMEGASAEGLSAEELTEPVTVTVLRSNPFVLCYRGSHMPALILAVIAVVVYLIGYPLFTLVLVRRRIDTLLRTGPQEKEYLAAMRAHAATREAFVAAGSSSFGRCLRRTWLSMGCQLRAVSSPQSAAVDAPLTASENPLAIAKTAPKHASPAAAASKRQSTVWFDRSMADKRGTGKARTPGAAAASNKLPSDAPTEPIVPLTISLAPNDAFASLLRVGPQRWTPNPLAASVASAPSCVPDKHAAILARSASSQPPRQRSLDLLIDTYPPIINNPALGPFTSGTYRASRYYVTNLDMVTLIALAAAVQLLQNTVQLWQFALKLSVFLAAVSITIYVIAVQRPFSADHAWKAPVRVYSLLLAALQALLNYMLSVHNAASRSDASIDLPPAIDGFAQFTFIAACLLLAILFVAFWDHILRSKREGSYFATIIRRALGLDKGRATAAQPRSQRLSTYSNSASRRILLANRPAVVVRSNEAAPRNNSASSDDEDPSSVDDADAVAHAPSATRSSRRLLGTDTDTSNRNRRISVSPLATRHSRPSFAPTAWQSTTGLSFAANKAVRKPAMSLHASAVPAEEHLASKTSPVLSRASAPTVPSMFSLNSGDLDSADNKLRDSHSIRIMSSRRQTAVFSASPLLLRKR